MNISLKDYKKITADVIKTAVDKGLTLNECIMEKVSSDWTEDQVKRLIEITNKSAYNSYFDQLENKKFAFKVADYSDISKSTTFKKAEAVKDLFLDFESDQFELPLLIEKAASHKLSNEIIEASIKNDGFFSFMEPTGEEYGYTAVKIAKVLDNEFKKFSSEILSKMKSVKAQSKAMDSVNQNLYKKKIAERLLEKCANDPYTVMATINEGMKGYPHAKELYGNLKKIKETKSGGDIIKTQLQSGLKNLTTSQFD